MSDPWIAPDSTTYPRESDMDVQAALKAGIAALEGVIAAHNADQVNECEARCGGVEILLCPTCPMQYIIEVPA